MRTVVDDDAVGHPKSAHEALDEFDYRAYRDCADGFHLSPLGEFVHGDVEVGVAPWRLRERAQNVQPLNCEWPGEGYGLQTPRRLMDLFSVKLAGLASLHQLNDVAECCGPVEPAAECLADEGS